MWRLVEGEELVRATIGKEFLYVPGIFQNVILLGRKAGNWCKAEERIFIPL